MFNLCKRLGVIAALLLVLGFGMGRADFAAAQDEPQDIRFFLTFIPNIQFSPLYVAIENGYMGENGLNLSLEYGDENIGVDLIAVGEIPFGVIGGEQVLLARAGGRPVVFVYNWFQRFPVGIVVPDTTEGVETVNDLAGLRVGIPGRFGASYTGLTALLESNDMTEMDINLEPIGFVAPDVVCIGGVDASVVYVNNEPLQIQQRADAGECGAITSVRVFYVADYAPMISNGIITNEATIANDPALVAAMVTAFDSGLRDVINNPAQAYLLSLNHVDDLPITDELQAALEAAAQAQTEFLMTDPDPEDIAASRAALLDDLRQDFDDVLLIQFQVLLETIPLWEAEVLGFNDPEGWALTQEIITGMGLFVDDGEIELQAAYTNAFLPE